MRVNFLKLIYRRSHGGIGIRIRLDKMGRHIGNGMLVRCKFRERLTDNADANPERSREIGTCRDYNHPPKTDMLW